MIRKCSHGYTRHVNFMPPSSKNVPNIILLENYYFFFFVCVSFVDVAIHRDPYKKLGNLSVVQRSGN